MLFVQLTQELIRFCRLVSCPDYGEKFALRLKWTYSEAITLISWVKYQILNFNVKTRHSAHGPKVGLLI